MSAPIAGPVATVTQTDAGPRSTCHSAPLEVTRVVHDIVSYEPMIFDEAEELTGAAATLSVKYAGDIESLDSDGYVVRCSHCDMELAVEVEEL